MPDAHTLFFHPVLFSKVWGGDNLRALGKAVEENASIGESWEVADLSRTSASGAGGAGVRSVIAHGPWAGRTIHDAIEALGNDLLAKEKLAGNAREFPLLVKLLDARENLSVQVHPSPTYAREHPEAHLKTECWIVMSAKPGAVIYKGLKPGVAQAQLERAVLRGDGAAAGAGVVDLLQTYPARVGECHVLPSGTLHALGAGVVVAEVQTPSDTTFRVFDFGRSGRELHPRQALACVDFADVPAIVHVIDHKPFGGSIATGCFDLSWYCVQNEPLPARVKAGEVCMVLRGSGTVDDVSLPAPVAVGAGSVFYIPAGIGERAHIRAHDRLHLLFAKP
jgi:mannose-6-phosphate isomerase